MASNHETYEFETDRGASVTVHAERGTISVDIDDPNKECSTDRVKTVATPDGELEHTRTHMH